MTAKNNTNSDKFQTLIMKKNSSLRAIETPPEILVKKIEKPSEQ